MNMSDFFEWAGFCQFCSDRAGHQEIPLLSRTVIWEVRRYRLSFLLATIVSITQMVLGDAANAFYRVGRIGFVATNFFTIGLG